MYFVYLNTLQCSLSCLLTCLKTVRVHSSQFYHLLNCCRSVPSKHSILHFQFNVGRKLRNILLIIGEESFETNTSKKGKLAQSIKSQMEPATNLGVFNSLQNKQVSCMTCYVLNVTCYVLYLCFI